MRYSLLTIAITAVVPFLAPSTGAEAQTRIYPYCFVQYGPLGNVSPYQCGYTSFAQCMATASGIGGMCYENPELQARSRPAPRSKAR